MESPSKRLRRYGFVIMERDHDKEPIWKSREGVKMTQARALESVERRLRALEVAK